MGSILNFVFLDDILSPNGNGKFARQGPLNQYIQKNKLSYTLNGQLKEGFRNILPIEIDEGGYSIRKIPAGLIQFINENDIKLLILGLPDPTGESTYKFSLRYLKSNGLNFDKLIYIDTNTKLSDIPTVSKHKIYTFDFFLEEATQNKNNFFKYENSLGYFSEQIELKELNNFRNKKFLCFNRSLDRVHRFVLLDEYMKGTFKNSYFSFLRPIDYATENIEFFKKYNNVKLSQETIELYNKSIPIELDTQYVDSKVDFNTSNTFKKNLFIDSCINLVTETAFVDNELFVSEKILKPILCYQPFIVFGPHGYLKQIKKYGFKTFSSIWNEEYDDIENSVERMKSLISLVKSLNSKSIEELNDIYKSTKEICIHNRNLFYDLELDTLKVIFEEIQNEW